MNFTEELRRFRERCSEQTYAGLVIPGSRQATTAALLFGALAPQRVASQLVHSAP